MRYSKPLIGVAGLTLAIGIAVPTLAAGGNKYAATSVTRDCGDNDTVVLNGPLKLWPPNHKFVQEEVVATDGDGVSNVTIALTPTVDDAAGGDGGPQHDPDFTPEKPAGSGSGSATANFQLRAERSGKGDGREYTINWMATFDNGAKSCNSDGSDDNHQPFVITVPHDMSGGADWKAVKP